MSSLERVVRRLISVGIVGELWIDGSFCTLKENPRDIDMVLRLTASFADKANRTHLEELARIANRSYVSLGLDTYHFTEWEFGHPNWSQGERRREAWGTLFSTSHDGVTRKGIPVLRIDDRE